MVSGGNGRRALTLQGVDPETCMIVFKNHWTQVYKHLSVCLSVCLFKKIYENINETLNLYQAEPLLVNLSKLSLIVLGSEDPGEARSASWQCRCSAVRPNPR